MPSSIDGTSKLIIDLEYDGRRHWFKVLTFKTENELKKALVQNGINVPSDTIAYTDNFVDGEECGRMYLYDTSVDTLSHEATHMALGILARHGHTNLVVTTEEEPELSHDLCKLVGAITGELAKSTPPSNTKEEK